MNKRKPIEEYLVYGELHCMTKDVRKLEADYEKLQDNRGVQEHRIMDLQDRFDNLKVDYAELEKAIKLKGEAFSTLTDLYKELEKEWIKESQLKMDACFENELLEKQRDTLHESNNRQSDIIYDLKVQQDELMYFAEWVLAEADRQRNGEGGDLRTIQHTAEALLTRIKEGEK